MNPSSDTDLFSQAGNWVMGTARRNPEGLLLLAAGCALLMRSGGSSPGNGSRSNRGEIGRNLPNMSEASSGLRKGLSDAAATATDYASDMKEKASDVAGSYVESVSGFADDARRVVSEGSERFRLQAQSTLQSTMNRVLREQPLAVAMVGLAAGAAVAAAFPATEVENRVLGGTHEALSNAVDQAGKSVMGVASKAGERLKEVAEERGFTADGLKDLAGEVANSFTDAVTGKAANMGTQTGSAGSSGSLRSSGSTGHSSGATDGAKGSASSSGAGKPMTSWPSSGGTR
jgi:hypothetical protein